MTITKCDLCGKRIKSKPITAGIGFFPKVELCERCGLPILKFLKKHKIVDYKTLRNKLS